MYTLDLVFHRRRLGDIVYTLEYIHRKRSLYLPVGSVNLVLKVMGTPDEISSHRVEIVFHRVAPEISILS